MRISHKFKFIFLSKPRCASTTVRKYLNPYSDITSSQNPPYHHHATALELKTHFDKMGWNWESYFCFTTVRNPWEMMVSYYHFFKPDINGIYNFERERNNLNYQADQLMTFKDWILNGSTYHRITLINGKIIKSQWVKGFSKLTLNNTINDINGRSIVNKIIKAEEIDNELPPLMEKLVGIQIASPLVKTNPSIDFNYRDFYDNETRKIIEKWFQSDIQYGKYKF